MKIEVSLEKAYLCHGKLRQLNSDIELIALQKIEPTKEFIVNPTANPCGVEGENIWLNVKKRIIFVERKNGIYNPSFTYTVQDWGMFNGSERMIAGKKYNESDLAKLAQSAEVM